MSSIEELKVVRLFRALNTMIQLCHDRGYIIRHPSAIAEAVQNPELYDKEEGLDHDWFLRHFVITPDQAARSTRAEKSGGSGSSSGPRREPKHEDVDDVKAGEYDEAVDEAEVIRRAANGEWVCMRNAMRLTCSVDPRRAPPAVKVEPKDTDGGVSHTLAAASMETNSKEKAAKNALMVFFSSSPKLSIKEVQAFREKALKKKVSSMIVVTNKVDPGVRMDVQELSGRMDEATGAELLSIQVFEEEALAFNVVRHETVPHHVALSPTEAAMFLAERKLNVSQLPRMLESDPLVQYLGLHRGSIVHITREGKQSGPYSMYRHVI
ncbi:RNA polymerase Rpb5, N-terminal domain/RNA polymerase Rpb5, C-terminal domain containing protein, putative [Leishmania lindenbergi]|uniref:RNA polymerase Rpb5, N-terminal domain n=1 Tax=Leishmania lindenbergi TaxID=651832 RepID=A0AAW3AMJ9_9TRYP